MTEGTPPDPLMRLGERLDKARAGRAERQPVVGDRSAAQQGLGLAFRIGVELVVAVVVATGLGWAIDRWLGTRPWGMIALFFLGVAAGMWNVYRAVAGIGMAAGQRWQEPDAAAGRGTKDRWDGEN
jgi:ATP synthase protein I